MTQEIYATANGILSEIKAIPGALVPVGAVIGIIAPAGLPPALLERVHSGQPLMASESDLWHRLPGIGRNLINKIPRLESVADIVYYQDKHFDGSGYPDRLAGEAIPLAGRIVAVADVFDALTSVRPYKAAWTIDAALAYIAAEAGKHFDPALVAHFLALEPVLRQIQARWAE